MLQEIVSGVEGCKFEIEDALDKQLGARPLPFPGMDSKCPNRRMFSILSGIYFLSQKIKHPSVNCF